jgi:hypothetical protein
MAWVVLPKLKKNSVPTTLSAGVTAAATTIPVTELSRFRDKDGTLITSGIIIGGDNANSILPEEITITGASAASGAGNLTGATRGVLADGTIGAGYAWPSGTNIQVTVSTGIYEKIKGNFDALDYTATTYTPTLTFGGNAVDMTGVFVGVYRKVGNLIFFSCNVNLTNKGSSVGAALVSLPASMVTTCGTAVLMTMTAVTFANQFQAYISTASPGFVTLSEVTEAGTVTALTDADFANNSSLRISGCYAV